MEGVSQGAWEIVRKKGSCHNHTHTYMRKHTHTKGHIHTMIHANICMHTLAHAQDYESTYTHIHTDTYVHTNMYIHVHIFIYTLMQKRAVTRGVGYEEIYNYTSLQPHPLDTLTSC